MSNYDVGINIKKIRNEKGLTQKELAELSGIHLVSIKKYETHKMKPQIQQLERIAQALNCNLEQLCEYKKVSFEPTFEPTQFEDYGKGLTVGDKIKICREKKKLTQLEVANLLNLKAGYVRMSQYENGTRTPKKEVMEKLASIFEVEEEYLKERNIEGKKDVIAILEEIKLCFGIEIIKDFISDYES